jgi:hypothetical protein
LCATFSTVAKAGDAPEVCYTLVEVDELAGEIQFAKQCRGEVKHLRRFIDEQDDARCTDCSEFKFMVGGIVVGVSIGLSIAAALAR